LKVRIATAADCADLTALHARTFPGNSWDETFWRDAVASQHDRVLVIGEPATACAVVRLMGEDADLLTIGSTQLRQGHASALLAAAAAMIGPLGVKRLFLEVSARNKAATALYDRFGFETVGTRRGYYQDGSDAAVMRLDLHHGE
jgi:ribosomal-protein-alanine N-acetyltransferase